MHRVNMKLLVIVLVSLVVLVAIVGSCARRLAVDEPADIWTPAPVSGAPLLATRPVEILPTVAPATPVRPAQPSPTQPVRPTPTPAPTGAPSPDPGQVVITEADVLRAVQAGIAAQGGATLEGVSVTFTEGRMIVGASRVTYGVIDVRNLLLVGRLVASSGRLRFEAESIAPGGLVTALIPAVVNQALAQYTSQWYIEEVRTLDGRLEIRIR